MSRHNKDKWISLSGYCKSKDLSVPKDFDLTSLMEEVGEDAVKVSGYKFLESKLDKFIPQFKFNKVQKREVIPKRLYIYELGGSTDGGHIVILSNSIYRDADALKTIMPTTTILKEMIEVNSESLDVSKHVSVFNAIETLVNAYGTGVNKQAVEAFHTKTKFIVESVDNNTTFRDFISNMTK